jgi:UDP-glucose 4-epimerase
VGEGAMSIFIQRALKNEPIQIHGDGTQIRAWCYIDDMVEGTLLAMEHPKAVGESFNVGNQEAVITIYGLAKMVKQVFSGRSTVDVELRVPAVKKARELLGFEAKVGLEDGIKTTAEYYRNNGE